MNNEKQVCRSSYQPIGWNQDPKSLTPASPLAEATRRPHKACKEGKMTKPVTPKDTKYKWVRHGSQILHQVGILADGTLYNPRGYPDDLVREAVLAANESSRVSRSKAAKKAASTRAARLERLVYKVVQKLKLGHKFGPCTHCVICGKGLDDPVSIERGIGSDCWQRVLQAISEDQKKETELL
jgi:Family of unknown function (DUF6011)